MQEKEDWRRSIGDIVIQKIPENGHICTCTRSTYGAYDPIGTARLNPFDGKSKGIG